MAPRSRGFTLIELIIVIAIIAVIAAVVFVAIDPAKRLNAAKDSTRLTNAQAIESALSLYATDNLQPPPGIPQGPQNAEQICREGATDPSCVSLAPSLAPYLKHLPVDGSEPNALYTGYTVYQSGAVFAVNPLYLSTANPLSIGLVSFWRLEEGSGNPRMDALGANTLSDNNGVTQVAGKIGNAAHFMRTGNQYLSAAGTAALSPGNTPFTIAAWVKADGVGSNTMGIISKYGDGSGAGNEQQYMVRLEDSPNRFQFYVVNGASNASVEANSLGPASAGVWYLVVAWYDGANLSIQVNNGSVDSVAYAAGAGAGTHPFWLGQYYQAGTANAWDGAIDAVGFWNRTLTGAERTALYKAGNGAEYPLW